MAGVRGVHLSLEVDRALDKNLKQSQTQLVVDVDQNCRNACIDPYRFRCDDHMMGSIG